MTLTRGPARILGFDPALARQPTVVMLPQAVKHIPKNLIDQGVRLAWVKLRRNPKVSLDPALKSINNLNNILAKMESMKQGAFEALMTNPAGEVAEGSISNIFWIKKGIVWTPALSGGILAGVTRGALIAMCREMGMVVKEGHGKPKQLLQADEVFLTSTTLEILPVSVVTDDQGRSHKIGSGRAGPWSLAYRKLFRTRIAHEAII
jgi:branched-chain amino acid aminotransferase